MTDINAFSSSSIQAKAKRIREIRERLLGLSREEFCKSANISHPALKAWELGWGGGLTRFGAKKFISYITKLGIYCTEAWLLHGVGRPAARWTKDLVTTEDKNNNQILKEILAFREQENVIDTIVKDDTMQPLLFPGDYVGGKVLTETEQALGENAIIIDENNDIYIRRLEKGTTHNKYNLVGVNQHATLAKSTIADTEVQFVAPIIWTRKNQ